MVLQEQTHIPLTATVLGAIGTVCWCVQLLPQIYHNYKRKSTNGFPASMMLLWALSGIPFGVYAILQNFNMPLQVQPQIFMTLCMIAFGQCLYYSHHYRLLTAHLCAMTLLIIFIGTEVILIILFRPIYRSGNSAPLVVIGTIGSILLALGLIPPYWEMYKRGGMVAGINFLFLATDAAGAFFSLMSLLAQPVFDKVAASMYCVLLGLELGIFLGHALWWCFKGRKLSPEEIRALERLGEKEDKRKDRELYLEDGSEEEKEDKRKDRELYLEDGSEEEKEKDSDSASENGEVEKKNQKKLWNVAL